MAASLHGDTPYSGRRVTSVPVTPYTTSVDVNLIRPGNPQVSGIGQVTAAGARTLGMVILGPVRDRPRHGRPRAARLLPALVLLRPLSSAPLLARRLPARQVIRAR